MQTTMPSTTTTSPSVFHSSNLLALYHVSDQKKPKNHSAGVKRGLSVPDLEDEAHMLLVDRLVSSDPSAAKETAENLLNSEDTKSAGEIIYRQVVVGLMSRFGGIFELGRPDVQGRCYPAHEDLVLRTKINVVHMERNDMPSRYTYSTPHELAMLAENCPGILHSPKHALVHPGIDAIMFDADTLTVWLVQVTHRSKRQVSPQGLLFLLDVVRGSPYEPSPTRPWQFVFVTRGPSTGIFFQLSGSERTQHYPLFFWLPRIKPYIMQLRDTDRDGVSNPCEQWSFPYKSPQERSHGLPQRLVNSLVHLVPRSRHTTESDHVAQDLMGSEIEGAIIRNSGVPGAQLLGDMASKQQLGLSDHYVRDAAY